MRAGRLIAMIPEAVIEGFAIAIVIATSQLKDLLGLFTASLPADFIKKLPLLWAARGSLNPAAVLIGTATITAIFVLRRLASRTRAGGRRDDRQRRGRAGAHGGRHRWIALWRIARWTALAGPAADFARQDFRAPAFGLVIAFLAGVESLLSAIVADRMIGSAHRSNAELLAQGAANIASPLFRDLPATGAIARTATNVRAVGRTPVAGMLHVLIILGVMAIAAPLAGYLAMPAAARCAARRLDTPRTVIRRRACLQGRPSGRGPSSFGP